LTVATAYAVSIAVVKVELQTMWLTVVEHTDGIVV